VDKAEAGRTAVLLCAERTLRRRCLAQFLELSGLRVRISGLENGDVGSEPRAAPNHAVDLAIIDTAEKSCRHPAVKRVFSDLHRVLPGVPIVVVSDLEDSSTVVDAIQLGARAYFPSSLDPNILFETLRFVQSGGTLVPPSELISREDPEKLPQSAKALVMETLGVTARELRVLELLQSGQSNKAIARELNIEESIVREDVDRILTKLRANNRTQAALLARQMVNNGQLTKPAADFQ
jgi:DNA-binding NarL/FixJ family response regulator